MKFIDPIFHRWFAQRRDCDCPVSLGVPLSDSLLKAISRDAFEAGYLASACGAPVITGVTSTSTICDFAIGSPFHSHRCTKLFGHTTPHQMVPTVQTLSGVRQG